MSSRGGKYRTHNIHTNKGSLPPKHITDIKQTLKFLARMATSIIKTICLVLAIQTN